MNCHNIFNLSLAKVAVCTCFNTSSIVLVPKHTTTVCPNDFCPVAPTPTIIKCSEKMLLDIKKPAHHQHWNLDQYAYSKIRSMEVAISTALHPAVFHLDNRNTCENAALWNTIVSAKLITKFCDLNIYLCNWRLNFVTNRILNPGYRCHIRLCVCPILNSLFTYNCTPVYGSNTVIKLADDNGGKVHQQQCVGLHGGVPAAGGRF